MPSAMPCVVDSLAGNCWMLLVSSLTYHVGMGLLTMFILLGLATAVNTCSAYEPASIGYVQRTLFYIALCLIAVLASGRITSLGNFIEEQVVDALAKINATSIFIVFTVNVATVVFAIVALWPFLV